mmetsp:Transcript_121196/g.387147  ORF Transcript_121196/g.387147 Transcript_121196/m.387147 type:complete len:1555 (-) Transcript_121196:3-4667(-)
MAARLPSSLPESLALEEGWLEKESRWLKQWKRRYVVLSSAGNLRTYTGEPPRTVGHNHEGSSSSSFASFHPAPLVREAPCEITDEVHVRGGQFWCKDVPTLELTFQGYRPGVSFRFAISANGRTIWFAAGSLRNRSDWITALRQVACVPREFIPSNLDCGSLLGGPPQGNLALGDRTLPAEQGARHRESSSPASPSVRASAEQAAQAARARESSSPPSLVPRQPALLLAELRLPDTDDDRPAVLSGGFSVQSPASIAVEHVEDCGTPRQSEALASLACATPAAAAVASDAAAPAAPGSPVGKGGGKQGPPVPMVAGGKGKCKGLGKAPPPPKAKASAWQKGAGKKFVSKDASSARPAELPIGRRLSLRASAGEAAAFRAPPLPGSGSETPRAEGGEGVEGEGSPRRVDNVDASVLDLAALREAFAPQPRIAEPRRSAASKGIELLRHGEAQNIAIVTKHLAKLKIDTYVLASALDQLNPAVCMMEQEEAERLRVVWPAPEVLQPLVEFASRGGDPSSLRDIERQILPLVKLPRMGSRLRLIVLAGTLGDKVEAELHSLRTLRQACSELKTSHSFLQLVRLVQMLFNYVNFGIDPGASQQRGFDVKSLLTLKLTKANANHRGFSGLTMLHYALTQFHRMLPGFSPAGLAEELSMVHLAKGVSLAGVRQELTQLRCDLAFVRCELTDHWRAYEPESPQPQPMNHDDDDDDDDDEDSNTETVTSDSEHEAQEPSAESQLLTEVPPQSAAVLLVTQQDYVATPRTFNIAEDWSGRSAGDPSGAESPFRPPLNRRRNLFQAVVGKSINIANFVGAWARGDEVLGTPEIADLAEPSAASDASRGFDMSPTSVMSSAPSGWLWLWLPSQHWFRCWAEIRNLALVLYKIQGQRCTGAIYAVLPNAKIVPFGFLDSSEVALTLRETAPYGFELSCTRSQQDLIICTSHRSEQERWIDALTEKARARGVGLLQIHYQGRMLLGKGLQRRHYCRVTSDRFLAFVCPREGVESRRPREEWPLAQISVRALQSDEASELARQLSTFANFGFEVQCRRTARLWQFVCESHVEELEWLRAFRVGRTTSGGASSSNRRPSDMADMTPSGIIFDVYDLAASERTDDPFVLEPLPSTCSTQEFCHERHRIVSDTSTGAVRGHGIDVEDMRDDQEEDLLQQLRLRLEMQLEKKQGGLSAAASPERGRPACLLEPWEVWEVSPMMTAPATPSEGGTSGLHSRISRPPSLPTSTQASLPTTPRPPASSTITPRVATSSYSSPSLRAVVAPTRTPPPSVRQIRGSFERDLEESSQRPSATGSGISPPSLPFSPPLLVRAASGFVEVPPLQMSGLLGLQAPMQSQSARLSSGRISVSSSALDDFAGKEAASSVDDEEEMLSPRRQSCLARLRRLQNDLEEAIGRVSCDLELAECDAVAVLEFFGLEAPRGRGPQLSARLQELLESLALFIGEVRVAWEGLEKRKLIGRSVVATRRSSTSGCDTSAAGSSAASAARPRRAVVQRSTRHARPLDLSLTNPQEAASSGAPSPSGRSPASQGSRSLSHTLEHSGLESSAKD